MFFFGVWLAAMASSWSSSGSYQELLKRGKFPRGKCQMVCLRTVAIRLASHESELICIYLVTYFCCHSSCSSWFSSLVSTPPPSSAFTSAHLCLPAVPPNWILQKTCCFPLLSINLFILELSLHFQHVITTTLPNTTLIHQEFANCCG